MKAVPLPHSNVTVPILTVFEVQRQNTMDTNHTHSSLDMRQSHWLKKEVQRQAHTVEVGNVYTLRCL